MLSEDKANYRRIYKSLVLLNYLLRNGSERVVTSAREHIYDLRTLENFTYIDELGKDQGVNIRHRAKQTIEFLQDDNRLREERKKAKLNKNKFVGVSSNAMAGSSSRYVDDYEEDYSASTNSNVFRDEREERKPDSPEPTISKPVSSPAKTQQSSSPDNLSRSKPTKNYASKKIDLGAAADYAKQHQQEQPSKAASTSQATAQSDILFDLDSDPTTSQIAPQSAAPVADLLDSLTLGATSNTTQENFADFSKVFSDEPQASGGNIKSTTTKDDDEFDDFRFSPLPAQQTTPVAPTSNQPKSTTQDDLLGLDLGTDTSNLLTGPQSLPLQTNVHSSSSAAGLSTLFFPTSNSGVGGGSNPSIFQADTFLTPLTPSKPTTLNVRSAEQLKEEETPKQSPTASAILSKKNTWSGMTENLKIDLDNLLQSKKEAPKPSMNQMAATRPGSNNNVSQTFAQGD